MKAVEVDTLVRRVFLLENTASYFIPDVKWGVWFSNGARSLQTSLEDIPTEIANQTMMFPNPVSNIASIDGLVECTIELYNSSGQLLQARKSGIDNEQFSMLKYSAGVYYFTITTSEQSLTYKVIKK